MTPSAQSNPEIASTVIAGGVRTNYHDLGEGPGTPLLLLHGSGPGVSAWANWRPVIGRLAEGRRVLAPDIVGFGYTERPAGFGFSRANWVRHLIDFLDALHLPRVSVVGNSFGGALALWLASQQPSRVERLVLMGSVGVEFDLTEGLDAVWGYEPSLEAMEHVMHYFAFDRARITDDVVHLRFEASMRPGVAAAYSAMFPAPRQQGISDLALSENEIRDVQQPSLLVHGRDDQVIPPETSLALHRLIPNSELHMFSQTGHWVQIEATDRFLDVVDGFLHA